VLALSALDIAMWDLKARRVTPFPPERRERVAAWTAAHAGLPRPDWAGRRIGLPGNS